MSHRPIHTKQLNRLRRLTRRRSLPAFIDLIDWLKDRRYAQTTGEAIRLLVDGKVKSESHIVGRERHNVIVDGETIERWEPAPRVPASLRGTLRV